MSDQPGHGSVSDKAITYREGDEITVPQGYRYKLINGRWVCQNPPKTP